MKYKFLTLACLIITSVLTCEFSLAQNQTSAQEFYELCSKFPLNSRCKGIKVPISLKERTGDGVVCKFAFDPGIFKQSGGCKLIAKENTLTIYQEQGDKIQLLEDRRSTSETRIKSDRIFISNYQVCDEIRRWEIGFVPENDKAKAKQTQTNVLVILLDEDTAKSWAKEFSLLSSYNPELLKKKVASNKQAKSAEYKQLLATNECKNCDLANVNLQNANLAGADLEGANLAGANLKNANLQQAKLKKTYMLGANLEKANLTQAELYGANLTLASLNQSILSKADLQGVNLQRASLQQANLTEANLSAPSLLQEANLANANLSNANLKGTNFKNANLRRADLTGADLSRTETQQEYFSNNYTEMSSLPNDSVRQRVKVQTYNHSEKKYTDSYSYKTFAAFSTSFLGANLEGTNLSDTNLDQVSFENANVTNTNFSNTNLEEEQLEAVKLCGVILADSSRSDRDCR